jgi:hypothetical protein
MTYPDRITEEYKEFWVKKTSVQANRFIRFLFDIDMPPCYFAGDLTSSRFGVLGFPFSGLTRFSEIFNPLNSQE